MEQHGSISVKGVGSLIGGMMERFGEKFIQHGAEKVRQYCTDKTNDHSPNATL